MVKLQLISRAVLIENNQVLLVKKKGASFWHYPGGKWEFEKESLIECARREVKEETGYDVAIGDLIWHQEVRKLGKVYVEFFWKAKIPSINLNEVNEIVEHIDTDENIEQIRWFKIKDLGHIKILPKLFQY